MKPKILCVDDEPGVLEALKRLLRDDFEVVTAETGDQGLRAIESNSDLAVILSDHRMPGMTGVEFLLEAKKRAPGAVRAILSGQIDMQALSEAINRSIIHRFIMKPWENDHLRLQMLEAIQTHNVLLEKNRLEHLAITDPVTELTNHRFFQDRLRREMADAEKSGKPLSMLMLDVDHFKSFNDHYGHPEGDRLLADIAQRIAREVETLGTASRYGGEEFAVVLSNTEKDQAFAVADRIRKHIEQAPFTGPFGRRAYITISAGVACYPQHATEADELVRAADRALYQAKRQGRNQTVIATQIPTRPSS